MTNPKCHAPKHTQESPRVKASIRKNNKYDFTAAHERIFFPEFSW
jgi:hypothetical protein